MANFGHWKIQSFCISTLEKSTKTCAVDGFHDTFTEFPLGNTCHRNLPFLSHWMPRNSRWHEACNKKLKLNKNWVNTFVLFTSPLRNYTNEGHCIKKKTTKKTGHWLKIFNKDRGINQRTRQRLTNKPLNFGLIKCVLQHKGKTVKKLGSWYLTHLRAIMKKIDIHLKVTWSGPALVSV